VLLLIAMPIFSINQGVLVSVLIFLASIPFCLLMWFKFNRSFKIVPILLSILLVLSTISSFGLQYESFRESLLGESFTMLTPISLGTDISWRISSSSVVGDFFRGLVGLGNDSFAIAYNLFRPVTQATIEFGNVSFTTASNELFTILSNRGLIGVVVWILLGVLYLRIIIKEWSEYKKRDIFPLLLSFLAFLTYIGSIFIPFSFLSYFLLFTLTLLFIISTYEEERKEEFFLKFWAINVGNATRNVNKTLESINWFFTILITLIITSGLVIIFIRTASDVYVVRAESYKIEMNDKYAKLEGDISYQEREDYLIRISRYYDKALKYNLSDPFINRKSALVAIDIILLLSEKYADASVEEKEDILSEVTIWRNIAIDLSKEAMTTSPYTYANWYARANVYTGLLSAGFTDYSEDALFALQGAINLNPLDYDSYYKGGQIFMIQEKYDKAVAAFNSVLSINSQHVPSYVLAARIFQESGDVENALLYLQAAKEILEVNELDIGEIYESIVDSIEELGGDLEVEDLEEETDLLLEDLKKEGETDLLLEDLENEEETIPEELPEEEE
jgi:hypothetical protein